MSGIFNADIFNNTIFNTGVAGAPSAPPAPEVAAPPKPGDEARRRIIHAVKPTGLLGKRRVVPEGRKSVDERLAQSLEIRAEVASEIARQARTGEGIFAEIPPPIAQMSVEEIDYEIGILLRKQIRTEEEDVVLLLLMMAAVA